LFQFFHPNVFLIFQRDNILRKEDFLELLFREKFDIYNFLLQINSITILYLNLIFEKVIKFFQIERIKIGKFKIKS